MFQTQAINTESYSPLAGLVWNPSQQISDVDVFTPRTANRPKTQFCDLSTLYPETVIASSENLGWHSTRVLQVYHGYGDIEMPPLENHLLIVQLESSVQASLTIDGQEFEGVLRPGDVTIIPAGKAARWRWPGSPSQTTLHIYLQPQFVQKTADTCDLNYELVSVEPHFGIRDERLSHIAMSLLYELRDENVVGRLYADSVASLLALQLIRRYGSLKDVRIRKGGMAPHKLRRAIKFITDNLDQEQDIALAVVAEEVGMSRFHFSRAFKQSMGLSPINYIAQQRIERAKKLLTETDLPIAEIALRAGVSGQSHFTTFFRRLVGATPRSFRRGI